MQPRIAMVSFAFSICVILTNWLSSQLSLSGSATIDACTALCEISKVEENDVLFFAENTPGIKLRSNPQPPQPPQPHPPFTHVLMAPASLVDFLRASDCTLCPEGVHAACGAIRNTSATGLDALFRPTV
jgi:hypothetical protein